MNIVIIGSGNVATHLTKALLKQNHKIKQVLSRQLKNAHELAVIVNAEPITDFSQLDILADLYIISVSDDALPDVVNNMPNVSGIVAHTAGSIGISSLSRFENYGVFYPFQTFTKDSDIDFDHVPVLIEANIEWNAEKLFELGKQISMNVIRASSKQRGDLHIAAVYACNFVNHMYRLAEETLIESGLSFELLKPLIAETANKVMTLPPSKTQTGPASRNDQKIISKHLNSLQNKPELEEIYRILTQSILARTK